MKKDKFLVNRQNKQRFIFMLSEELTKKNGKEPHASGVADILIVQKAVPSASSCNTVLVGDDVPSGSPLLRCKLRITRPLIFP